jgi:hypothetical protein
MALTGISESAPPAPLSTPDASSLSNPDALRLMVKSYQLWVATCTIQYTRLAGQVLQPTASAQNPLHFVTLRQVVASAGLPSHPLLIAASFTALKVLLAQPEEPSNASNVDWVGEMYDNFAWGSRIARGEGHPASILGMQMWIQVCELNSERSKGSDCTEKQLTCTSHNLGATSEYTLFAAQKSLSFARYLNDYLLSSENQQGAPNAIKEVPRSTLSAPIHRIRAKATLLLDQAAKAADSKPLFRDAQVIVEWWLANREVLVHEQQGEATDTTVAADTDGEQAADPRSEADTTGPTNPNIEPPAEE